MFLNVESYGCRFGLTELKWVEWIYMFTPNIVLQLLHTYTSNTKISLKYIPTIIQLTLILWVTQYSMLGDLCYRHRCACSVEIILVWGIVNGNDSWTNSSYHPCCYELYLKS